MMVSHGTLLMKLLEHQKHFVVTIFLGQLIKTTMVSQSLTEKGARSSTTIVEDDEDEHMGSENEEEEEL